MKSKLKKKHKKQKFAFYQDSGMYSNETLVCVGMRMKDALKYLKRTGAKKEMIDAFSLYEKETDELIAKGSTPTVRTSGACMILLADWKDDWEHLDTLNHEVVHIIQLFLTDKGFDDEDENCAYLHEYLFREIRRKLSKRLKCK